MPPPTSPTRERSRCDGSDPTVNSPNAADRPDGPSIPPPPIASARWSSPEE